MKIAMIVLRVIACASCALFILDYLVADKPSGKAVALAGEIAMLFLYIATFIVEARV